MTPPGKSPPRTSQPTKNNLRCLGCLRHKHRIEHCRTNAFQSKDGSGHCESVTLCCGRCIFKTTGHALRVWDGHAVKFGCDDCCTPIHVIKLIKYYKKKNKERLAGPCLVAGTVIVLLWCGGAGDRGWGLGLGLGWGIRETWGGCMSTFAGAAFFLAGMPVPPALLGNVSI